MQVGTHRPDSVAGHHGVLRARASLGRRGARLAWVLSGVLLVAACGSAQVPQAGASESGAASAAVPTPQAEHATGVPGHPHPAGGSSPTATPLAANNDYDDLRASVVRVLESRGSEAALASLQRQVTRHPDLSGVCHAVAHDLGHAALQAVHGNAAAAMDARNDVCGGGFIHGVVEAALADSKHPERDLVRICAPANDGTCWHGVGHGAMFASHYRVHTAESLCTKAPTARLVGRCAEGVYMQLFTLDDGAGGSHVAGPEFVPPTSANAPATCAHAGSAFAGACWLYAPTLVLQEKPEHWATALHWCARRPAGLARDQCTAGVGSRLIKYHPDDVPFAAKMCRAAAPGVLGRCLAGMGSYWRVHWHGTKSRISVCDHLHAPDLVAECRSVNA